MCVVHVHMQIILLFQLLGKVIGCFFLTPCYPNHLKTVSHTSSAATEYHLG